MNNKPRRKAQILSKDVMKVLIYSAVLMTVFTLATFFVTYSIFNQSVDKARTTTLVALILLEILGAFNFRSFRKGVLNRSPMGNFPLFISSFLSIIATLAIIYITPIAKVFGNISIPYNDWIVALGIGLFYVLIFDVFKRVNEKKKILDLN